MKSVAFFRTLLFTCAIVYSASISFGMTHPGISHSQADLNRMKNNIGTEPYKTAFAAYSASGYAQSTNTGQGPFTYETYGHGQFEIRNDAAVCHANAIMWYVTGNKAYLNNAITIMMGWANTLTAFDVTDHITAGTAMLDFTNAGEIIRATGNGAWTTAQITTFQTWLITYLYPPLLTPGNSIAANQLEAAGHGGLQISGLVSLGIFCDRSDIYNFGISSALHDGSYTYGLQEYIYSGGQNYETQRDQGHASGNISTFVSTFNMAYNQGTNYFGTASNLLAKALESQAKIDLNYNVVPQVWTAADGSSHNSVSGSSRQVFDNLDADLAYHVFHDIQGLNMPYTLLSANAKYPNSGTSFLTRVDASGQVPLASLIGSPSPVDVVLFADGAYSGGYLVHLQPGTYSASQLNAAGVTGGPWGNGTATLSSLQIPVGWTVTVYDNDNQTGNTLTLTATSDLTVINSGAWNDRNASLKIVAGTAPYPVLGGTYKLVNVSTGLVADVSSASTASGASIIQDAYQSQINQLWRVEAEPNGQFRLLNLHSNLALEVPGSSTTSGKDVDQAAFVAIPDLATGGTASSNAPTYCSGFGCQVPAYAFDGSVSTEWFTQNVPSATAPVTLEYAFATGTAQMVTQYMITPSESATSQSNNPSSWQVQGSLDGTTWVTLDIQTGQVFANPGQVNTYPIANTKAYGYYRLSITANVANSSVGLVELSLYSSQQGNPSQLWAIAPVSGTTIGSALTLQNKKSANELYVCSSSGLFGFGAPPSGSPLCQYTKSTSALQHWSLQVP